MQRKSKPPSVTPAVGLNLTDLFVVNVLTVGPMLVEMSVTKDADDTSNLV